MNDILGVAEGRCDAVIGCPGEIWDHAPNQLLVEEAGGCFRDELGGHRIDVGRATYSNGAIDTALGRAARRLTRRRGGTVRPCGSGRGAGASARVPPTRPR